MKKILNQTTKTAPGLGLWFRRVILAWLTAAAAEFWLLPKELRDLSGLDGIAQMSGLRMILITAMVLILVSVLERVVSGGVQRWLILVAFGALAAAACGANAAVPFLAVCMLVLAVLLVYAVRGWNGAEEKRRSIGTEKGCGVVTAVLTVAFFLLVSLWTVCRVYSFSTPSYDFSIFAQMFHSMRTTGLPMTTIERDGPLSHFAVHVSPIYYVLLPFYSLWPRPEMLQILQAAVLASGVLPLWLLGKRHGLCPLVRSLVCLMLLLYPAYAGGASYDIHENAFLTPLLLWLFYAMDRKSILLTVLFATLTLTVKEDAAVYVAVAALYLLVRSVVGKRQNWGLVMGVVLLLGSVAYFAAVTGYLTKHGDGVMTYRYDNFMYRDSDSLVTVILAVLLNPMKAVYECVDQEKLKFIGLTLLPLGCLPLLTRRYERFLLLIPYVLVNLMSDYQYQHDIFFQYTYGATGCLVYMTLTNLADFRVERRQVAGVLAAVCVGAACFGAQILPKALSYPGYCVDYEDYYDGLREALEVIPEDAPAAGTTFFTTSLSQRDVLYDVRYASQEHLLQCRYIALNPSDPKSFQKYGGYEGLTALLEEEGYELIGSYSGALEIYGKNGT